MSSYCTRCGVELPDYNATHRCLAGPGSLAPPPMNEQQAGSWRPPSTGGASTGGPTGGPPIVEQHPSIDPNFRTPVPSGPNYVTVDAAQLASRARRRSRLIVGIAIGAVVVLGGGVALWQLTSEDPDARDSPSPLDDDDAAGAPSTVAVRQSASTSSPVVDTTAPAAPTTVPSTAAPPTAAPTTATEAPDTTPPPVVNPFGDTVGAAPGQSPAGQLAIAVQSGGATTDDAVVLHSDAFYYALWSRLTGRSRPDGHAIASADGYTVDLDAATVELSGFTPSTGPIETLTENGIPIDEGVRSFDLCGPVDCPGLSVNGFVPDAFGSGAKLFALAKVSLDPQSDTYLMFIQYDGFVATAATGDNAIVVPDPNGTNILAVTYSKNPPAGTQLTLSATSGDQRTVAFTFGID